MGSVGKGFMYFGLGVALIGGLYLFLVYFTGALSTQTADYRGEVAEKEQVKADPDYRIANQRYFYDLCGDIQAKQQNIESLEAAGLEQEAEANRVQLNEMAADYNAAAADSQRGAFKQADLPYEIDPEKEVESCGTPG